MTLRLTVQETGGNTQIMVRLPGVTDPEPSGSPLAFTPPLSIADSEDLRFYLEDYASLPVGEFAVRGERVEQERLSAWGEALFASIFEGNERRDAYVLARAAANRGEPVEFAINSNNPRFLALPWELMKAPDDREPFSLRAASFDRSLLNIGHARQFASAADGFRVLMVIARPDGIRDVPFQAVARPLFRHLERAKNGVRIEILRPPSFEEFCQRLKAAKEGGKPYHAVHFDGHGTFGQLIGGANGLNSNFYGGTAQGYVLFEGKAGGAELIGAGDFASALKEGGVPLVILNACQSGKIETADEAAGPEASVATRLLQDGAASVVAMSHSVYVVAAAAFMAVFYEALFAGKSVSEAVNTGRKALRLEKNRLRPSLKGNIPLQDWIVPVHYARSALRLPQSEVTPKANSSAEETAAKVFGAAKIDEGHMADDLAANDGVFFGRDAEFFILERAIRTHGLAVIHGVGGTGKTELAKAFARWLQISGGLDDPRLVFFHSFEPGLPTFGLDLIVNEIMARFGQAEAYLAASTTKERAELVLQFFHQARCLLIWDNFETVASMPEPGQATPPLDDAKKDELLWFIGELRKSKSALLITSRSEERWLGEPEVFVRCEVGGLAKRDALQYADHLLAPHAQASARRAAEPDAFKELNDYLGGHPLSLKLILPRLSEMSPLALLAGLKGQGALPPGFGAAEGRLESLGASLYYSFRHLPEEDRQRLVILSLFEKVASVIILGTMEDAPSRFQGVDPQAWDALLDRLSDLGLLTGLGGGLYRLHPALPPYLGALWSSQAEAAGDGGTEREAALRSLIGAAASFANYLVRQIGAGEAQMALTQIAAIRASLGAFLAAALDRGLFAEAQQLIQALNEYWDVAGVASEAAAWGDRTIKATEPRPGQAPEIETPAHDLWLFVSSAEANRALDAGDLAKAEDIYRRIAASFEGRDDEKTKRSLATVYHQLGIVEQDHGRLDEAEGWYKKALAISEALGNQPGMAISYHQLGRVAEDRGRTGEAEDWYKKSLAIFEALADQRHMAECYHQLGRVAQMRNRPDEAEGWYRKSLAIKEALGDQPGMASSLGQLGLLARLRGRLDEADDWFRKSLAIDGALSNQPGLARTYHNLGVVAQDRGRLDEAEGWYKKSLAIREDLGAQPHMAESYHQLGSVAQERGSLDEAAHWFQKAFVIFEALGDQPHLASSLHNLGLVAQLRNRLDEAEGWYRKSLAIFEALGDQPHLAPSYNHLGIVAQDRGRVDEAEGWYGKSLAIYEALGDEPQKAIVLRNLAKLKASQGEGPPPQSV
jgi:tetratricopeptide (TPR) repeat protein